MVIQRILVVILFSFLLLICLVPETDACTCAGPRTFGGKNFQPCGVYWGSDVVFIGSVNKITLEKTGTGDQAYYSRMVAHFSVEKAIRGVSDSSIDVETSPSTASCGYPFKEGERYFVYVRRGKDGRLMEHLCGATVLLEKAERDLDYLRAVEAGEKDGRVFGNVSRLSQNSALERPSYSGLGRVKIRLTGVKIEDLSIKDKPKFIKRKFETITDEDGFYIFFGIPEGTYKIESDIPNGLREMRRTNTRTPYFVNLNSEKQRCGGASFYVTSLGSIEGKAINQDGLPPPQQYIWLLPLDENRKAKTNSYIQSWINPNDGKYYFDNVAPGDYLLAVNPKGCPNKGTAQYGRSFFPETANEQDAQIITIKEAEHLKISNYRFLPTLSERSFSGTVLSPDGTPVVGATVFLNEGDTNKCMILSSLSEVKTDEFGRFRLTGYAGYGYKIRGYVESRQSNSGRLYSEPMMIPSATEDITNLKLFLTKQY